MAFHLGPSPALPTTLCLPWHAFFFSLSSLSLSLSWLFYYFIKCLLSPLSILFYLLFHHFFFPLARHYRNRYSHPDWAKRKRPCLLATGKKKKNLVEDCTRLLLTLRLWSDCVIAINMIALARVPSIRRTTPAMTRGGRQVFFCVATQQEERRTFFMTWGINFDLQ